MSEDHERPGPRPLPAAASGRRPATPFICPGSSQSISRALHLARLNAAWPNCDQCEWRHDSEGLAERTIHATERIRDHRANGIRRTEFGIRGQYINELNRHTTAALARVFCMCLNEHSVTPDQALPQASFQQTSRPAHVGLSASRSTEPPEVRAEMLEISPVVVGYDGRNSSPDIFVGVITAIREFGLPVLDIGRCTSASVQEAARSITNCSGSIFVTGSGMPLSWTGLDVCDPHGDPVPVVWKEYGVRLQQIHAADPEPSKIPRSLPDGDDMMAELLHRARAATQKNPGTPAPSTAQLRLLLPSSEHRNRWLRRLSRNSGAHEVIDFEPRYRQWLKRWYPDRQTTRVLVRSDDPMIQQRVTWLAENTELEILARSIHETSSIPDCQVTMTIEEDDRQFVLKNSSGERISPERLASLINAAIYSQASQVTAHADSVSGRFWLTDAGRHQSSRMNEHVRDALAILGLTVRLMTAGRLTLSP